ncbi:MAG: hypothetical protein CVV60_06815, partial [Tenericutes bacterium HGW-Tenericutes-5]
KLFTRGSLGMPKSWNYSEPLLFKRGESYMEFNKEGNDIILKAYFPKAKKGKGIKANIQLSIKQNSDLIANIIPFKDPTAFVYAQKINCMLPNGEVRIGDKNYVFNHENDSYGVLDWTRSVFPYKNSWKWCSASGKLNNKLFGFNLDYGFGAESSKNMLFYDGVGHHLDEIKYLIDWKNPKNPIKILADDDRVNLILTPVYFSIEGVNLGLIRMQGAMVYGFFIGYVQLDNGEKLEIKETDRLFGWAENFYQRW